MNLVNAQEAADMVGVSKQTMSDWCHKGIVPMAQKVGRTWVIPVSSLDAIKRPKIGRPPDDSDDEEGALPSQG